VSKLVHASLEKLFQPKFSMYSLSSFMSGPCRWQAISTVYEDFRF